MKKTMLALMATVGLAFIAKAEVLNSTGFEYATFGVDRNDSGEQDVPFMWSAATTNGSEATSLACAVTNYTGGTAPTGNLLPDAFVTVGAGDNYLAVDTSGDVLYRNVNDRTTDDTTVFGAAQSIGDGLFFDSDVQFTATDSTGTPEPTAGDKLIVWLSADDEAGTTNLIVTASIGHSLGESLGTSNYTNTNQNILVKDNEWHRLTVAAATNGTVTTFKVYVDGEQVTADGVAENKFYSLVAGNYNNYNALTAVGFQGTGAIDNLVWAAGDPFPEVEPTTVNFSLSVTGRSNADAMTCKIGDGAASNVTKDGIPATVVDTVNGTITIAVTVADDEEGTYDVAATLNGVACSVTTGTTENETRTDTITINISGYETGSPVAVAVTITEAVPPTPSEDTEVAPGGEAHTTTKEAAEAVVVKAPDGSGIAAGETYNTYASYFTRKVTGSGSDWTTTFELNESGTNAVEAAFADLTDEDDGVLAVVFSDKTTVTVRVPQGFYWALSQGASLGGMTNAAGQLSASDSGVTVEPNKALGASGFYQLLVSPQQIPAK